MTATSPVSAALGGDPIQIDGLSAADAMRIAALVEDAKVRQSKALDDAIDGGLGHIPRLLRGSIKAVLFR